MATSPAVQITADAVGLSVTLTHGPSSSRLEASPPKDNGGTGAAFSPTDLVGASLVGCALITMALRAQRDGIPWGRASGRVEKVMVQEPRRIGELRVELQMPKELPAQERAKFEEVARTCPVARSLHPELQMPMTFVY